MNQLPDIAAIILAAGASTRLGQPKQLVSFGRQSLLQRTIQATEAVAFSVKAVVLGAKAGDIAKAMEPGNCQVVHNSHWREGMGSSIRIGLGHVLALYPETAHVLFLLSDQPFVSGELVKRLVEKHRNGEKPVTASFYRGMAGVPAIFSKLFFEELMAIVGDTGAKKVIKRHPDQVQTVPFEQGEFDLDTPEDFEKLKKMDKDG